MDDVVVPDRLCELFTLDVATELASVYGDQVVFPEQLLVDRPGQDGRWFPGWPTPVLVLSVENQGVCAWGVPLDDPDPPVLVGGDDLNLATGESARTVVHAASIDAFIQARRWDGQCFGPESIIQAQADELDAASLRFLRARFDEVPSTAGWPGRAQLRFEGGGTRVLLWSGPRQCDWWISNPDPSGLRETVNMLMHLSNLRQSLWANQPDGEALLRQLRQS